jgi:hypothetical protein
MVCRGMQKAWGSSRVKSPVNTGNHRPAQAAASFSATCVAPAIAYTTMHCHSTQHREAACAARMPPLDKD